MICFAGCVAANCRGRPPCLPEQRTHIPINSGQTRGSAPTVGCRQRWRATPLPLREGLGGGSFVDVIGQLLAAFNNELSRLA